MRSDRGVGVVGFLVGLLAVIVGFALPIFFYYQYFTQGYSLCCVCGVSLGLIFGGLLQMFRCVATPRRNAGRGVSWYSSKGAAYSAPDAYAAPSEAAPQGYCWQCGSAVRKGNAICYACGATQAKTPPMQRQ